MEKRGVLYRQYMGETDLPDIMELVQSELSEPYVIYTYRYFLHQWPHLSFLVRAIDATSSETVGVVVCKQSLHRNGKQRGYIGMLSVRKDCRKRGIGKTLANLSIQAMSTSNADEVILETEYDNVAALGLYEALGFIREKRLFRFYMNGKDAFRLLLDLRYLRASEEPSVPERSVDSFGEKTELLSNQNA
ncbi:hypothetical protein M422DRAFT_196498 [Sphaerobolus stellatus SS14]|uniref:N-acetyltransferase domain-containing protein n=1 Tax=Sphaerobolus stellatus (strain SS14) TaxID=990650 RepID=A0A0C9U153_SPHS4|nr:hypothetical protein M422DRAFT_196773 [Sphaerobolus stellatus SS14]KIJ22957.1 hypothetical protein M422DRAFT_196498 [Sphaerobolus stellatus SS14]